MIVQLKFQNYQFSSYTMQSQSTSSTKILVYSPILLIILAFIYSKVKHHQSKKRLGNLRNRQNLAIDDNKIIIAIEPTDIFVSISTTRKDRYIELQIEKKGASKYISAFKKFFKSGLLYYKVKQEEKKNNIAFLQSLLQTKKVELVLYTQLEQQVIDYLLKKLDLTKYFNQPNRKFYHDPQDKKHPTEIDSNIKRVIIISGDKNDYTEDSQYFLVLRKRQLREYGRALSGLIANNRSIDELHNEFVHWKIEIESDYDSSHQKLQ